MPYKTYGKEHPEYFALMKDGQRLHAVPGKRFDVHLCLSNPEVRRISTERLLPRIESQKERTYFIVTQGDGYDWCQCDACKTLDHCLAIRKDRWRITQFGHYPPMGCPELLPETRDDGSTPLLPCGHSWMTWFLENDRLLPLPTFNVLRMLSMLEGELVEVRQADTARLIRCIASRDGSKRLMLLVYNFDMCDMTDQRAWEHAEPCSLNVSGLAFCKAKMTHYRVSRKDGDFRLAWVRMGRPDVKSMSEEQWSALERCASLSTIDQRSGLAVNG